MRNTTHSLENPSDQDIELALDIIVTNCRPTVLKTMISFFMLLIFLSDILISIQSIGATRNLGKPKPSPLLSINNQTVPIIPARLPPRTHLIPIANEYGLSNVCSKQNCGDFHVVIYYLDEYSCSVTVRRFDGINWKFNVSIYIETHTKSQNNLGYIREILNIGTSPYGVEKQLVLNTTIPLIRDDLRFLQPQIIPKTILQTYASRKVTSIYQWNAYQSFAELNPEYEILMYTDKECREFLKTYFPTTLLEAYDLLISPTFKSDIFRYAYLVLYGGCYFDHKMILRQSLHTFITHNDTFLVCSDALPSGQAPPTLQQTTRLYNAIICTQRQDYRLWQTIKHVLYKIEHRYMEGNDLSLTGPAAFFQAIHHNITEENIRFKHGFRAKSISHFHRKYEDYYIQEKNTIHEAIILTKFYKGFTNDPKMKYGKLWLSKLVYYDYLGIYGGYKLYVYPQQSECVKVERQRNDLVYVKDELEGEGEGEGMVRNKRLYLISKITQQYHELFESKGHTQLLATCRYIKLLIIQDDTSDQYRIEIPFHDIFSTIQGYQIPFLFV